MHQRVDDDRIAFILVSTEFGADGLLSEGAAGFGWDVHARRAKQEAIDLERSSVHGEEDERS